MADPNDKLVQQGGMMIPETLVRPQTPLLSQSQNAQSESKGPSGVAPLTKRMSMAFDRNIKNDKPKEDRTNIVALGRLFLELEQVNNNLELINREVAASSKRLDKLQAEELELLEKEGDRFTAIGASFQKLRRQFGGIAALLAGKQFLEGDIKGGFQNSIFAISAFLPEIIKVTSGIVLGRMLLSGRGGVASRGVASVGRGRGLMGLLLAGGGLFGANSILGSQGGGDQRRFELTRRQALPQLLSRNDLPSVPKSIISFRKTSGLTTTPGPIITLEFLFRKPLGSILTLKVFSPSLIVWPAFGPAPPLTTMVGLSFCAKYEIIFPLPSSPKKPPITIVAPITQIFKSCI